MYDVGPAEHRKFIAGRRFPFVGKAENIQGVSPFLMPSFSPEAAFEWSNGALVS